VTCSASMSMMSTLTLLTLLAKMSAVSAKVIVNRKKVGIEMNVVVTNLDGTKTPYSFEASVGKSVDIVGFYTKLYWEKGIAGFTATADDGFTVSVGA